MKGTKKSLTQIEGNCSKPILLRCSTVQFFFFFLFGFNRMKCSKECSYRSSYQTRRIVIPRIEVDWFFKDIFHFCCKKNCCKKNLKSLIWVVPEPIWEKTWIFSLNPCVSADGAFFFFGQKKKIFFIFCFSYSFYLLSKPNFHTFELCYFDFFHFIFFKKSCFFSNSSKSSWKTKRRDFPDLILSFSISQKQISWFSSNANLFRE